jgi:hypothetical protein
MNLQNQSTIKLKTNKKRMLFIALGASMFVAMGLQMLAIEPLIGWLAILFFGLCCLIGIIGLFPNSSYLELTTHGFTVCSLYRKHFLQWSDIREFHAIKIHNNSMLGWNYQPNFKAYGIGREKGRKLSRTISGVEASTPDTYGMEASELAALMNKWRMKYANMQ